MRWLFLLLLPTTAWANGLTTHVWITLEARRHLPPGELRELLEAPELQTALVSGTTFPDGGYAVDNGYGELAHWEPFHLAYLDWIRQTYPRPWTAEACQHVAFLLGMMSHGMADQYFDSLYMARARIYDAESDWQNKSMDEATDVVWAAKVGPQPGPKEFLPVADLIPIFEARHGHRVDAETIERGQQLTGVAVWAVGTLGMDPEAVRDYRKQFPWATSHLDKPVPGAPAEEAQVVAKYWQKIWERLTGTLGPEIILSTVPQAGAFGHPVVALGTPEFIESRVSVVLARSALSRDLTEANFDFRSAAGVAVPFELDLFYGNNSHVVHLIPKEALLPETDYRVTVQGVKTADGFEQTGPSEFSWSTKVPSAELPEGCQGSDGQGAWWLAFLWLFTGSKGVFRRVVARARR